MQSLRGIRDIHESGVDEHSFSEVKCMEFLLPPILATSGLCKIRVEVSFKATRKLLEKRNRRAFGLRAHPVLFLAFRSFQSSHLRLRVLMVALCQSVPVVIIFILPLVTAQSMLSVHFSIAYVKWIVKWQQSVKAWAGLSQSLFCHL